jgi:hypothetical protein
MTFRPAVQPVSAGAVVTEQSCAASGTDNITDGVVLVIRNTGAGTHIFSVQNSSLFDGLAVATPAAASGIRQYTLLTGQNMLLRVPSTYGDANNLCNLFADGTPAEVKYNVLAC